MKTYPDHVNIALVYKGKIIALGVTGTRRAEVRKKLFWRKLYGRKFRECELQINFNR